MNSTGTESLPHHLSAADAALDYEARLARFHAYLYNVLVAGDFWSSSLNRRISRAFPIRVLASSLIGSFFAVLQLNIAKNALAAVIPNIVEKFGALLGFLFALGGQWKAIVKIYLNNPLVLDELQGVLLTAMEAGFYISILFLFLAQARFHFAVYCYVPGIVSIIRPIASIL